MNDHSNLWVVALLAVSIGGRTTAASADFDSDFSAIIQSERAAISMSGEDKLRAYRELCQTMTRFINTYFDKNYGHPAAVKAAFRLAQYYQRIGDTPNALRLFEWCRAHPRIADVTWEERPLSTLVNTRMNEARESLAVATGSDSESVIFVRTETSKEHFVDMAYIDRDASHKPLTPDESFRVVLRRLPSDRPEDARAVGLELLKQDPALKVKTVFAARGIVVFGIADQDSSNRLDEGVNQLSESLASMSRHVQSQYLQTGKNMDSILYVYANFDGSEELGRRISKAVHFRETNHLAAYYSSLDNAIVLRKGLGDLDRWFLGTVSHELVHAFVNSDCPGAPTWIDEGMASLHEEMSDGKPVDNYRVFYVQEAIRLGKLPSIAQLVRAGPEAWEGRQAPLTIAMSRYLAMFLLKTDPEKKWLTKTYQAVRRETMAGGPRPGEQILEQATGIRTAELDERFRAFVMEQRAIDERWLPLRDRVHRYVREY